MLPPQLHEWGGVDSLIDSKVLKLRDSIATDLEFIKKCFNNPKQLKLRLIFRASEHEFRAAAFHQKCDNIANTLTVARTEFGKTIGGFSKYKWNEPNNLSHVVNSNRETFLLHFDYSQKMVPIVDNRLIYCRNDFGPTFGGGHDLYIGDNCFDVYSSYANFPNTYNFEGPNKYLNTQ